ncbi:protein HEAT INTOLERANT 4-like [Nymphaea colorata]|nr:protein HEAT INTOLERANT 4-like [Nymphaea colorata]
MRRPRVSGRKKGKEENEKQKGESPEGLPKGSTKASTRGKRVKAPAAPKPKPEPEYLPDRRNLEDLWIAAFPVGTEWHHLDSLYKINWDFSNLEKAFEEGGVLFEKKVYLFGCTEAQFLFFKGQGQVLYIPAVVAVVSPSPPSDKIGIKSVQMETEKIVPMKEMKMAWVPYVPLEDRLTSMERFKAQIFTLSCTQRRAALGQLKEERVRKYEYCLPYFYHPFKEDEQEVDTVVQIMYPMEPPVVTEFDWELDELEEFTNDLIEKEALPEEQKDDFKKFVKERVVESKKKQREAKESRKKAIEEMSEQAKENLKNMRFYKFYPVSTPDTPDISSFKSRYINRYYEKAHEVF